MGFRCRRWVQAIAAIVAVAVPLGRVSACSDLAAAKPTRWSLSTVNGRSWLVTPCGQRFFSLGVNALDGGYPYRDKDGKVYYSWTAFAPSGERWVETTRRRLADWGFNSAGGWTLAPQQLRLPTIVNLELGRNARFHWFDPFAPETAARMIGAGAQARRPLSRFSLSDRLFFRQRSRLVGRRAVCLLFDATGQARRRNSAGSRCCASIMAASGRASPPISCRRQGSARGLRCSPPLR